MKAFLLFMCSVSLSLRAAVINVGETVPNLCWKDMNEKTFCLDDAKSTVRVLIYNAGWCGPCNSEMQELVQKLSEFVGKPVTFVSLSCQGWKSGSQPTPQFLKEWKEKHKIPFVVAASPGDCGGKYFVSGTVYIPNVAVVGKTSILGYKEIGPSIKTLFDQIKNQLKISAGVTSH